MKIQDRQPSLLNIRELHERYHSPALGDLAEAPRYSMYALADPLPYVDAVTPVERHGGSRNTSIRIYNLGAGKLPVTPRARWEGSGRPATVTLQDGGSTTSDVRLPKVPGANRILSVDIESPSTRDWWTHTELALSDGATGDVPEAAHVERQWRLWQLVIVDEGADCAEPHEYFLVAGFDGLPSHIRAIDCKEGVWTVEVTTGGKQAARYRCAAQGGDVCPPLAENDNKADHPVIRIPCPDSARSATASKEWLQPQRIVRLRRRDTSVRVVRAHVALSGLRPGVNDVMITTAGPDGDTGTVRCVVVAPVVADLGELTVDRRSAVQARALDLRPRHPSVHVDPTCDMRRVMRFGDEVYAYRGRHAGTVVSVSSEITAWQPVSMDPATDAGSWEVVVADPGHKGHHDYRFDVGGEWRADPLHLTRVVWGAQGLVSCRLGSPAVQEVNVENRGKRPVEITVRSPSDWVTGSPNHQTVAGGATGSIAVRIDPSARPLGPSLSYVEVWIDGDWAPFIVPVYAWVDVDGPVLDISQTEHFITGSPAASVDIPVRVWGNGGLHVQLLPPRNAPCIETTLEGTGYGTPDEQNLRVPLGDLPAGGSDVDQLRLLSNSCLADRRAMHLAIRWPSRHVPDIVVHLPRIFPHDRTVTAFFPLDIDGDDWSALDIRLPEQIASLNGIRCEPSPTRGGCVLSIDPRVTPPGRLQGSIELRHASRTRPRHVRFDAHILDSRGECHLQSTGETRQSSRGPSHVLTIRNVGAMDLMVFDVQASDRRFDIRPAIPPRTILAPGEQTAAGIYVTGRRRWIPRTARGLVRVLMSDAGSEGRPWVANVSARV